MTGPGWLSLGASPSFALMALVNAELSAGGTRMLCGQSPSSSVLGGMTVMYLLMSLFHAAPWLKLLGSRNRGL
jgi:hypothetical protein